MELAGQEVALGESLSEWLVNMKAKHILYTTADFINTVSSGYMKFIFLKTYFFYKEVTFAYWNFLLYKVFYFKNFLTLL